MRKKAFTLTELLIVVIVLGTLAGVAVPKLSRVLETRRTTEAEEILAAVRTEQEKRCVMGKKYLGAAQRNEVTTLANANISQNYKYELLDAGIAASRKDSYTLQMPYRTGEICCSGSGCEKLNKNYPVCSDAPIVDECSAVVTKTPDENPCADPLYAAVHPDICGSDCNDCTCPEFEATHGEYCCEEKGPKFHWDGSKCRQCTGNQHWNGTECVDEGCPKDPDDCPGGYYTDKCQCVKCNIGSKLNAAKNGCECDGVNISTCAAKGQVFVDHSKDDSFPFCSCMDCEAVSLEKTGKTSTGRLEDCDVNPNLHCSETHLEECAKQGLVVAGAYEPDCVCKPCSFFGAEYTGKSSDGYLSGCEKIQCDVNEDICGAQGKVFYRTKCKCEPCSAFGRKGATPTGKMDDCTACDN